MKEKMIQADEIAVEPVSLFAKFGNGRWYAILPGMEVALRKAGAEVCLLPVNSAFEKSGH